MLTSYADDEALIASIMAGAAGYVLKQVEGLDLIETIRRAGTGESLLDPAVVQQVTDRLRTPPPEDARLARLTGQERRILALIADGLTNRQIAAELHLAEKTVESHRANLLRKLGMRDRVELVRYAIRRGLTEA